MGVLIAVSLLTSVPALGASSGMALFPAITAEAAAAKLKITTQPKSVAVAKGKTATVKVAASGDGLSYRWYYKNAGSSKFVRSTTVKGKTYTVKMNAARNGRQLYCVVTDKAGNKVTTKTVTISITGRANITTQPKSVSVKNGETATVKVAATGKGLTYKWYYKNVGNSKFVYSKTVKTATYSAKMTAGRHGRQLYCVITDKYGNKVTTETVKIKMSGAAKITVQPKPAIVTEGKTATVKLTATGSDLTYQWYYKNSGSSKFVLSKTVKTEKYSVEMTPGRSGRQVYCVVTDKYGVSVKSKVVSLRIGIPLALTLQPESTTVEEGQNAVVMVGAAGEKLTYKWYYKNAGSKKFTLSKTVTGAVYAAPMSASRDGRQIYCVISDETGASVKTNTVKLSMTPPYQITLDLGYGEPQVVGVQKDGKYTLSKPKRPGYGFKGWQTLSGKDFAASGVIDKDVTVKAVWQIAGTDTLQELIDRTNAGATKIAITGNIVINQPIYISHDTTIYANKDYTLTRDPKYKGDLFVVGKDAKGVSALMHHRDAVLTLGGGKGTLTIDGNRSKMKVNVVGSAIFVADSATLNVQDGVRICNNLKTGNDRVLGYTSISGEDTLRRSGGAAILNMGATVNIYGGTIENNLITTEHTVVKDELGNDVKKEYYGCGGAIYNDGYFNMYGGTIKNNEALRGGAIYNDSVAYVYAGTIQGNKSHTYGGAISSSASSYANTYLGEDKVGTGLKIIGNYSKSAGGALYSNTTAPFVIYGNTLFQDNRSDYSGGAIYTGGSLIVRNTTFRGNSSLYSGGAVYFHNTKDSTWTPREAHFKNCDFEENSASLGGAITFSRSNGADEKATGVKATITDCRFSKNQAIKNDANPGNGGAIYVTQLADVTITGCKFSKNTAASSGGGVSVNGKAHAKVTGSTFTGNTAVSGGGMYLSVDTVTELSNLTFDGNNAVAPASGTGGTGGAIHAYCAKTTMKKLDIRNNTAAQHAGAIYLAAINLTLGNDTKIENNSAGDHGGAFYLTYRTNDDKTKTGAVLTLNKTELKGNTAKSGGAISARTSCEAILNGAKLINNTATAPVDDVMGGGAIYVGYGKATLSDATLKDNTSAYYGGAIFSRDSEVEITGGSITGSTGGTGAALYFREGTTATMKNVSVSGNTATNNGVLYINGGSLDMENVSATENKANQGGVLYTSGASTVVTLKDSIWSGNSAINGGTIYMDNASVKLTNATVKENTAKHGGAIYNKAGVLTTEKVTFTDNAATGNGGAIYLQGSNYEPAVTDSFTGNTAVGHGGAIYVNYLINETDKSRTPSVLTVPAITFSKNTAMAGGAISARSGCIVNLNGTSLIENSVSGVEDDGNAETVNDNDGDGEGGGAVYVGYGELTMTNVTATGNTASDFGGVVDAAGSTVTITGGTFTENTTNNGGVLHAMNGCTVTVNGAKFNKNASLAENTEYDSSIGGGVFHTIGGTLEITGSTFDGNTSANYGGVIHSNKTAVTINGNTAFTGNTGATGAVMHMRSAKVVLENISVVNNTSNMNGVIYYLGTEITIDNIVATGNKAYQGGVLFPSGTSTVATVKNCTWNGNSATNGGVIYSKGATVNLENCVMTENTAKYGGAVYVIDGGKLNLTGVTFHKNNATADGGAIYTKASVVTAADTETAVNTFTENTAKNHGGAVYVVYTTNEEDQTRTGGVLNMTGGSFTGNTAMGGGAVSVRTDCEASFDGTVFTENKVTGDDGTVDGYGEGGGAVYVGYGKLTMNNVTATGNTSGTYSGAVHLLDTETVIADSTFTENQATEGGAIYGFSTSQVTITDSTFTGNNATGNTGAVYLGSKVTGELKNLVFDGNHADGNGGALMLAKATVTTDQLDMQNNSAGGNGGAVYLQATQMNIDEDDVFKGNTADGHGGVFYLTYSGNDGASLIGTNAVLENNTAKAGGAISSRSYCNVELTGGSLKNNSATAPQPEGLGGGAIYSNTNTLKLHGVILEGNTSEYYGGAIYATEVQLTIDNKTQIKANGGITGVALYFKTSGTYTLNDVTVTENVYTMGVSNGLIYATGSSTLDVTKLTATKNKSVNGGVLFMSGNASGTIQDSVFTENTATDKGGVINFCSSGTLNVTNNTFSKNTAKNGGAIYCENGTMNVSGCQMTENTATQSGGAISIASKGTVNIAKDNVINTNTAKLGGAVYLDLGAAATLTGITLEENTATSGGAIAVVDTSDENNKPSALTLTDVILQNNTAKYGGALDVENGSTVTINGGTMTKNTANLGGAIYNRLGEIILADAVFTENTANKNTSGGDGNGGAIVVNGGDLTGTATFDKNAAQNHAGALYLTYVKGTDGAANIPGVANMTGGAFTNNTAMGGGAVSIRTGCSGIFENVTFTDNSVSGWIDDGKDDTVDNDGDGEGGGAIYVGYGSVTLNNVTATGNTATDTFGGFLDAMKGEVTVNGGSFTGNTAPAGGAFFGLGGSNITIKDAVVSENDSTYQNPDADGNIDGKKGGGAVAILKGSLTVSGSTLDGNTSTYYGGAILASGATVDINNKSVVSGSVGKTGGAIYLRDTCTTTIEDSSIVNNLGAVTGTIYLNSGTLDMKNVTATGNQATSGGVIYPSGTDATVTVTGGTYSGNTANYGGVINNNKGNVTVDGAEMKENTANLGGAIYSSSANLTVKDSTFTGNTSTKDANGGNGNGGAISIAAGTLNGSGTNVFKENTAENHGGAIYVSYVTGTDGGQNGGVVNITDGLFEKNSAPCGGAISSRTNGSVTLTGTVLKGNVATASSTGAQGGAIYTNDGTLTLSGVTLDGNTTNYYGAAVYSIGTVFTATDDCIVKNNTGITGAAIWLNINSGDTATITDMTLQKNLRSAGTANGTIYANGNGTLNITGLTASENVSSNGGILYTSGGLTITLKDSTLTDNQALTVGGIVAYRGTKTMEISGCTISGNTAPNGGVVEASGAGTLTIKSSTLESNTATDKGGAIYATGSAKVVISEDTTLKTNTAKYGGAIHLDLGATVTINNSTLDGNSTTGGEGGAIMVADSTEKDPLAQTKLEMTNVTLQNNTAKTRGGALATDYDSPKVIIKATNCTFYKNTSTTSGGAVAIQCCNCNSATDPTEVNIVFTNCTFRENYATTDGGALDVRSGSCMKIDGITAEGNTAKNNAGVVYVTSNNTRLYITGEVNCKDNTAKSGNFSYLYNNKYTTPPKMYTTHANTASWYADVTGNRTNVAFDLTTLP